MGFKLKLPPQYQDAFLAAAIRHLAEDAEDSAGEYRRWFDEQISGLPEDFPTAVNRADLDGSVNYVTRLAALVVAIPNAEGVDDPGRGGNPVDTPEDGYLVVEGDPEVIYHTLHVLGTSAIDLAKEATAGLPPMFEDAERWRETSAWAVAEMGLVEEPMQKALGERAGV